MMTKEQRLTLRDILHDFRHNPDVVTQDYVEAHIACLIEEAEERAVRWPRSSRHFVARPGVR